MTLSLESARLPRKGRSVPHIYIVTVDNGVFNRELDLSPRRLWQSLSSIASLLSSPNSV